MSLTELMETLQTFGFFSGFKLNILKTQVLTFIKIFKGYKRDYFLNWDLKYINYIGINIHKDMDNLELLNYGPINNKIKTDNAKWIHLLFFHRLEGFVMCWVDSDLFLKYSCLCSVNSTVRSILLLKVFLVGIF